MKSEKPTRVVVYSRTFRPEPTAAALRLGALCDALVEQGCEVEVITSTLANPAENQDPTYAFTVKRFPVLRDKTGMVRGYVPYLSFDIPGFFRLLTTRRPDAIVCEPPPTSGVVTRLAAGIRRVPYVYYAGDIVSDAASAQGTHPLIVSTVRAMERWVFRGAKRVITVGMGVVQRIEELSGKKADLVPNGIDTTEEVSEKADLAPAGFPEVKGPVILYAGTVADWLAPEIFIDPFKRVREVYKDAALVYLGQGSAWESLQTQAEGIEGVYFVDALPPKEAHKWYARADLTLASLRPGAYEYAYPTKILASLAAGTPVIYAGPGDATEDVNNNDLGIAVDLDQAAIEDALLTMLERLNDPKAYHPHRLWTWVDTYRSVRNSSRKASAVVLDAARS